MKQTLFIVIALLLFSFFAFNLQRWTLNSEINGIRTELIAPGVATKHFDENGTRAVEDLCHLHGPDDPDHSYCSNQRIVDT